MAKHEINKFQKGEIAIYKTSKNEIALLFDKERSVVTKHINKIFTDKEVDKKSNVQKMHIPSSDKPVELYSLDVILSVGYRVNSSRAIHFRRWATKILKRYLVRGYAVNEKRLFEARKRFQDLQEAVLFLQKQSQKKLLSSQGKEIINLLADYSKTLLLLEQYDKGKIKDKKGKKGQFILSYENCLGIITELKKELVARKEAGDLFGTKNDNSFKGIIRGLYQTFDRRELYPDIENKAAHLLYLIIKDHPFIDGNKRTASFLFVYFLDESDYLFKKSGERKINDNALAALALLVAESDPKGKEVMIKIIKNLIAD